MTDGWYPKNKGKVRGWPRRLRHVEAFRQRHLVLDEAALAENGRDWLKLWIDPWCRLVLREPPVWLRRRMLAALLDVHRAWHDRLTKHERATGEPFDCMVWLLHPHFGSSQVVFAVGEWRGLYRDTFPPAQGDVPPCPPALYDDPAYDLGALTGRPSTTSTTPPRRTSTTIWRGGGRSSADSGAARSRRPTSTVSAS